MKKRLTALFILLVILLTPMASFAHDAYFLQVLIDTNSHVYRQNVIADKVSGLNLKNEGSHIEEKLKGDFYSISNTSSQSLSSFLFAVPTRTATKVYANSSDIKIFTFPSRDASTIFNKWESDATNKDIDRAYTIADTLVPNLNDALKFLNKGEAFKTTQDLIDMSNKLATGQAPSGFNIEYGKRLNNTQIRSEVTEDSDYVIITNTATGEKNEYLWRMHKGYTVYNGQPGILYREKDGENPFSGDTEYITWQQLAYQGNFNLFAHSASYSSAAEFTKPGALEKAITALISSVLESIRNLLGLSSVEKLVYAEGERSSQAWVYGIMPSAWMDSAKVYHWIFQALAWSLILLAMLKMFAEKNISTVNPVVRSSLIESVKDLIITGFLLANIYPFLNLLMLMNAKLVQLFNFSDTVNALTAINNSGMLGGVILQVFYFCIMIYFNFVYIMRAIMVTILFITSPLFMVSIAFGSKYNQLFKVWLKEMVSNIYLQSFHAFLLGLFLFLQTSSRGGMEALGISFAMIPLSEWFRSLFFGQSGSFTNRMGMQSLSMGAAVATGALSGAYGKARGGKARGAENKEERLSNGEKGGSEHLQGTDGTATSSSVIQQNRVATFEAQKGMETPVDKVYDPSFQPTNPVSSEEMYKGSMAKAFGHAGKAVMGAGKAGIGMGKVAVGLGAGVALGDPRIMKESVTGGVGTMREGTSEMSKNFISAGGEAFNHPIQRFKESSSRGLSGAENTELYAEKLSNGDVQVHHDSRLLEQRGILGASEDSNGNAVYTYDRHRMKPSDVERLNQYEEVFRNNDPNMVKHVQGQGIQRVSYNREGNLMVAYNKIGKERLGIKSVRTLGSGANKRVVETKNPYQPWQTAKTINLDLNEK